MAVFLMLDEATYDGRIDRKILVNVDAIIRTAPNGTNHCYMLMASSTSGPYEAIMSELNLSSSLLFIAESLESLQIK